MVAFSAAASAIYLVNDLRDREKRPAPSAQAQPPPRCRHPPSDDRRRERVRFSPSAASLCSAVLGPAFGAIIAVYLALNVGYSYGLKNVVILDVMIVASGYLFRVVAGGVAARVEVSTWILLCTTFLALFLVFSKRRHEIILLSDDAVGQRAVLHHYSPIFLDQMINVVTASTLLSYAMYTLSPDTEARFGGTSLIFTLPFVLFGIFRYLYLVYPGERRAQPDRSDHLRCPLRPQLRSLGTLGHGRHLPALT